MNRPIVMAQLGGASSTQPPQPVRIIKLAKPADGQSQTVFLGYDQKFKIDLSGIASEKLTFVHVGEKLIILFENRSTLTLDPFFASGGNTPRENVSFDVNGREISGAEFASIFPVTTDLSVLPAAGDGAGGTTPSGANFGTGSVDPFAIADRLELLGQEELGNFVTDDRVGQLVNGLPTLSANDAIAFDEDGLTGGNLGGIGDFNAATNGPISLAGTLAHNFGSDGAGSVLLLGTGAPAGFTYVLTGNGTILTVVQQQNGVDVPVLRITLSDTINGNYVIEQLAAIRHLPGDNENDQQFVFNYRVSDSNNDTIDGSLSLTVDDDSPTVVANPAVQLDDEAAVTTYAAPNAAGVGDVNPNTANVAGTLGLSFGADGGSVAWLPTFSTAGGATGLSVTINAGGALLIQQNQNGNLVTVATVTLNSLTGAYTVTQNAPLFHAAGSNENDQSFTLNYRVTDNDGDTVDGTLTVNMDDDTPTVAANATVQLDDESAVATNDVPNVGGIGDVNPDAANLTGTLAFSAGADGGRVAWQQAFISTGGATNLSSIIDGNGSLLIQQLQNGNLVTVMTVTLNPLTGAYTVTQNAQLFHAAGGDENNQTFTLTYRVTDGDGDTADGTLTVNVDDDMPTIAVTLEEGEGGPQTTLFLPSFDESVGFDPADFFAHIDDVPPNTTPDPTGINPIGRVFTFAGAGFSQIGDMFDVSSSPGADGAQSQTQVLSLTLTGGIGGPGVATTLTNTALTGVPSDTIYLFQISATEVIGVVGNDPNGAIALRFTLLNPNDPVTAQLIVEQYLPINHGADGNNFDSSLPMTLANAGASLGLTMTATIIDRDGDVATSTATVGIADNQNSSINIQDDGPSLLPGQIGPQPSLGILALDETIGTDRYNTDVTPNETESSGGAPNGTPDDASAIAVAPPSTNPAQSDAIGEITTSAGVLLGMFPAYVPDFGIDGPGPNGGFSQVISFVLSRSVVATSLVATALDNTPLENLTAAQRAIVLVNNNGVIEGRIVGDGIDGNGDEYVVFRITINNASDPANATLTFDQFLPIDHGPDQVSVFDESLPLLLLGNGTLDVQQVTTVTDGDTDMVVQTDTVNLISSQNTFVTIDDDGPLVSVTASASFSINHDETLLLQNPNDILFTAVFNNVANPGDDPNVPLSFPLGYARSDNPALSVTNVDFGSDGAASTASQVYSLTLTDALGNATTGPVDSGLFTTEGQPIYLFIENGLVVGRFDAAGQVPDGADRAAFAVAINASTGIVSMVQYVSLFHGDPSSHDESVALDNIAGNLNATLTVTDGDGDQASASAGIGASISFDDDGPFVAALANPLFRLTVDESAGNQSDDVTGPIAVFAGVTNVGVDPDAPVAGQPLAYATETANPLAFLPVFGVDGPAPSQAIVYSLVLSSEGVASGLSTTNGLPISLFTETDGVNTWVVGRYDGGDAGTDVTSTGNDPAAFAIYINPTTGQVSIVEYVSIQHTNPANANDERVLASGVLEARVTIQDGDFDTASSSADISGRIAFRDDGPTANNDVLVSVQEDVVGTVGGNVLANDLQGADGATLTHVQLPGSATFVAISNGPFVVAGIGTYTFAADGTWTFDPVNNQVSPSDATFNYRITDGDGDTSTATQPITIRDGAGPLATQNAVLSVDEEGLENANARGSAELATAGEDSTAERDSEIVTFQAGSDDIVSMAFGSTAGVTVDVNGDAVADIVWSGGGTNQLIGTINGIVAITVTLTSPALPITSGNSGSAIVAVTLSDNFPHLFGDNVQTSVNLTGITVVALDIDNTPAAATVTVTVVDDVATANDDALQSVAEDAVSTIGGNLLANDVLGADGATLTHVQLPGSATFVAIGGSPFVVAGVGTYTFGANGDWTFDPVNNQANPSSATFNYRLTDGDGDTDDATQPITITDGSGPLATQNAVLSVDEEGIENANARGSAEMATAGEDSTAERDSEFVTFQAGSDNIVSMAFGATAGVTVNVNGNPAPDIVWSGGGTNQLIGKIFGITAITITLTPPALPIAAGNTDSAIVSVTLSDNFPHLFGDNVQTTVDLTGITVVALDTDNTSATATVTVTVVDDVPTASDDAPVSVSEDVVGTISGNVLANDVRGADGATLTHVQLPGSATFVTINPSPLAPPTVFVVVGVGTFTLSPSGAWTFDPVNNLVNPADATFSYRLTDSDGDTDEATQPITITDGAAPSVTQNAVLLVDEEGLENANARGSAEVATAGEDSAAERDNEFVTFKAGSDNIVSMAFGSTAGVTVDVNGDAVADIVWSGGGTNQLIGTIGGIAAITVTLTPPALPIAAGATGSATVVVTLSDNFPHLFGDNVQTSVDLTGITVVAVDTDNTSATATVTVSVVDDVPTANAGPVMTVLETAGVTAGTNLLANDVPGADGATLTAVDFGLGSGFQAINAVGTTTIINANGTYTFQADGTWSFDPVVNASNSNTSGGFTYRITDGDGDTSTATQVVTIENANNVPTGDALTAAVDDEGLPHGIAGGTLDDATTASNATLGTLTGSGGDGALTFTLSNMDAGTAVVGQDTVTYSWDNALSRLTATITSSPQGGRVGLTLFTVDLSTSTGLYIFNVVTPVLHANAGDENNASVTLTYRVGDSDGDTSIGDTGTGTLTVSLDDDSPAATFTPDSMRIENGMDSIGSGALNFFESIGADGGKVTFNVADNTALMTTGNVAVTANGVQVRLYVDDTGTVLTAKIGADVNGNGGTTIFTVTLNPNGTEEAKDLYTVQFSEAIDDGSIVSSVQSSIRAGNTDYRAIDPFANGSANETLDVLVSGSLGANQATVNSSSGRLGVGGGQSVHDNETLRFDFMRSLTNVGNTTYDYDEANAAGGHYKVTDFKFTLTQADSNMDVLVRAYNNVDEVDPSNVGGGVAANHYNALTNDTPSQITAIFVNGVSLNLNDRNLVVPIIVVGNITGYVIRGLDDGDSVQVQTATGYERVEVMNAQGSATVDGVTYNFATGDKFDITGVGFEAFGAGGERQLQFSVTETDADGDTRNGTINITTLPADGTLTGTASGEALVGGIGAQTLNGGDGDDTLTGGAGADVLNGGNHGTIGDTVLYDQSGGAVTVNLTSNTGTGGDAQGDTYSGIENAVGSAFGDTLTGNASANRLHGLAGHDTISGGGGNDIILGSAGNDIIDGGTGLDRIVFNELGAANRDTINNYVGSGADRDILDISNLVDAAFAFNSASNFVRIVVDGGDPTDFVVQVDSNGLAGGANFVDVAVLNGYNTGGSKPVAVFLEGQEYQFTVSP